MKAKELRDRSMDELFKTLSDLEEQLFKLRFQKSTGQIQNPIKVREVRTTSKFMAHDEENRCNTGDRVLIEECRPLSKRKRWRVSKIVERAQ